MIIIWLGRVSIIIIISMLTVHRSLLMGVFMNICVRLCFVYLNILLLYTKFGYTFFSYSCSSYSILLIPSILISEFFATVFCLLLCIYISQHFYIFSRLNLLFIYFYLFFSAVYSYCLFTIFLFHLRSSAVREWHIRTRLWIACRFYM